MPSARPNTFVAVTRTPDALRSVELLVELETLERGQVLGEQVHDREETVEGDMVRVVTPFGPHRVATEPALWSPMRVGVSKPLEAACDREETDFCVIQPKHLVTMFAAIEVTQLAFRMKGRQEALHWITVNNDLPPRSIVSQGIQECCVAHSSPLWSELEELGLPLEAFGFSRQPCCHCHAILGNRAEEDP